MGAANLHGAGQPGAQKRDDSALATKISLARRGEERYLKEFINGLRSPDEDYRVLCIKSLGRIGSRSAVPELVRLLDDQRSPKRKSRDDLYPSYGMMATDALGLILPQVERQFLEKSGGKGYVPIQAWKAWWEEHKNEFGPPRVADASIKNESLAMSNREGLELTIRAQRRGEISYSLSNESPYDQFVLGMWTCSKPEHWSTNTPAIKLLWPDYNGCDKNFCQVLELNRGQKISGVLAYQRMVGGKPPSEFKIHFRSCTGIGDGKSLPIHDVWSNGLQLSALDQ